MTASAQGLRTRFKTALDHLKLANYKQNAFTTTKRRRIGWSPDERSRVSQPRSLRDLFLVTRRNQEITRVPRQFVELFEVRDGATDIKQIRQKRQVDRVEMLIRRNGGIDSGSDRFHSLVPFQISHRAQRKNYHGRDDSNGNA